jgi:hypothetical protein
MNSMTPISSLASTMGMILKEDLVKNEDNYELTNNVFEEINESLNTIKSRSKGLISFFEKLSRIY